MENTSHSSNESMVEFQAELWFAGLLTNSVLIFISFWLLASIALYGIKYGKFRRNKRKGLRDNAMMRLALLIAILMFPRISTTNALLWIGYEPANPSSNKVCEAVIDLSVISFYLGILPVGFFLWLRQRSLYQQPSLVRLYTIPVKIISWGCIIFLFVSGCSITLVLMIPTDFNSSWNGCNASVGVDRHKTVRYILSVVLAIGELALLGLFIYPLYRHRKSEWPNKISTEQSNARSSRIENYSSNSNAQYSPQHQSSIFSSTKIDMRQKLQKKKITRKKCATRSVKTSKRIFRAMRISVVCASICIFSDLFSFVLITFFLPANTLWGFRNTLHDINLLINFLCVIFCFETYKNIFTITLFNCKSKRSITEPEPSSSQFSSKDCSQSKQP